MSRPAQWERLQQRIQLQTRRLPPTQNRLDDVRRQQGQTQDATDVGRIDLLGGGDLCDGRVRAVLQHLPPAKRPGDRLASTAGARGAAAEAQGRLL